MQHSYNVMNFILVLWLVLVKFNNIVVRCMVASLQLCLDEDSRVGIVVEPVRTVHVIIIIIIII